MEEEMENIKVLVQNAILTELATPRVPKTFTGRLKPVTGTRTYPALPINYQGTLGNELQVYWETDKEDGNMNLVVDFGKADYWQYVEYGRQGKETKPSNKYPPLDTIEEWARTKSGLGRPFRDSKGKFMSYRSIAFMFQRSIGKYGIYPSLFIEKALNKVIDQVEEQMADLAAQYFSDILINRIVLRDYTNNPNQ
jgi:hypothetical protein